MTKDVRFAGHIDQAAAGNVENNAPRYSNSNTVNVHVNANTDTKDDDELLTFQQLKEIRSLVGQIIALTKQKRLDVWNPLLARAGAKNKESIRRSQYLDLEQYLRAQLKEAQQASEQKQGGKPQAGNPSSASLSSPTAITPVKVSPAPRVAEPPRLSLPAASVRVPCKKCLEADQAIADAQRFLGGVLLVAVFLFLAFGFVSYRWYVNAAELKDAQARTKVCGYDGKIYAIVSAINIENGVTAQCEWTTQNVSAQWKFTAADVKANRKNAQTKVHYRKAHAPSGTNSPAIEMNSYSAQDDSAQ